MHYLNIFVLRDYVTSYAHIYGAIYVNNFTNSRDSEIRF